MRRFWERAACLRGLQPGQGDAPLPGLKKDVTTLLCFRRSATSLHFRRGDTSLLGPSPTPRSSKVRPRRAFFFGAAVVLVTWHDASFTLEESDTPEDYLVETLGWVVNQSARILTIAGEKLPDGDGYRALSHIHLASIETVENLQVG